MIPDFSKKQEVVVTTFQGMEEILAEEMRAIGVENVQPGYRAVTGSTNQRGILRLNYELRTGLKVLMPLFRFRAVHSDHLYKAARKLPWSDIFGLKQTFAIEAAVSSHIFKHSQFAALRLKDAIADHFRNKYQARPNVSVENPDFSFHLRIDKEQVQVSLNTSGISLHKRGYRVSGAQAPLSEALAAGMLQIAGWDGKGVFFDPMCGSGTIAIEAAMMAANMPAQMYRPTFGFENLEGFDVDLWEDVQDNALSQIQESEAKIYAADVSRGTVDVARENASRIHREIPIRIDQKDFTKNDPPAEEGLMVMNPPYGLRIQAEDIIAFYKEIGDTFKQRYSGWTAWVLSGNAGALKQLGLRTSQRHSLHNGPLPCKYWRYDMYAGSKKNAHLSDDEAGAAS